MRFPFFGRRTEDRSSSSSVSYSDEVIRLLQARAGDTRADAQGLAAVETAAGLWSRGLASATITPDSAALRGMTPSVLLMVGRGLAYRGEFLAALEVIGGIVKVLPAASWTVEGQGANPMDWSYRLTLAGPSGTETVHRLADAVLHVRLSDPQTPWKGRSPLSRSPLTAELAGRIEDAMTRESKMPTARVAVTPLVGEQADAYQAALKTGAREAAVIVPAGAPHAHMRERGDWEPYATGPRFDQYMEAARSDVGQDVLSAYGIPPNLFSTTGDGSGAREGWRRLWLSVFQPLGMLFQDELQMKLDTTAEVGFPALRAADEDVRSRAVMRRATAAERFVGMGAQRDEAFRLAGVVDA